MCVVVHQSVAEKSKMFLAELSRHNYVTPTSYLELLGIFAKLLQLKKMELKTARNRTKLGLDKVNLSGIMFLHQLISHRPPEIWYNYITRISLYISHFIINERVHFMTFVTRFSIFCAILEPLNLNSYHLRENIVEHNTPR